MNVLGDEIMERSSGGVYETKGVATARNPFTCSKTTSVCVCMCACKKYHISLCYHVNKHICKIIIRKYTTGCNYLGAINVDTNLHVGLQEQ